MYEGSMTAENSATVDTLSMPVFTKVWLTSFFLVAAGSASEAGYGGSFDHNWVLRMLLLAAIPLVMVDRLAILKSKRAREILGARFWIYATNAFGAYWATLMVFIAWPSLTNLQLGITIWIFAGGALGFFEASRHKIQTPDLADQYLDLEKFQTGNWFIRTSYLWWVPFAAILLLGMIWTSSNSEGTDIFSERYLLVHMFIMFAFVGGIPDRKPILNSKIYWTRAVGATLFLIAVFANYVWQ